MCHMAEWVPMFIPGADGRAGPGWKARQGATPAELSATRSQPQDQLPQRGPEPAGGWRLLVTLQDLLAQ